MNPVVYIQKRIDGYTAILQAPHLLSDSVFYETVAVRDELLHILAYIKSAEAVNSAN